jgi:perosamine synthetase
MNQLTDAIITALKQVLVTEQKYIALHEPTFHHNEWKYVKECLDSGWVSSAGAYVQQFEKKLAEYVDVKHAIAVVNGTSALHVCLLLAGVEANDEVLIPTMSFVATANAIAYCGAIPHFVDSSEVTLGMDPHKLQAYLNKIAIVKESGCFNKNTGRRIKAIVPMHTFGHPVDLDMIQDISASFHIPLVEDAAESLGSYYKGKHTGTSGLISALSFNGNKIITTGGGGAILTNDDELAKKARHLTTTAKMPHSWEFYHDQVGYNYRMPNLNAALGCAQLEQLEKFIISKRNLAEKYKQAFMGIPGVSFYSEPESSQSNYWLNVILLDREQSHLKEEILRSSHEHQIMTRPVWNLLHTLPMYEHCPKMDTSMAEGLYERIINIPSSAFLNID